MRRSCKVASPSLAEGIMPRRDQKANTDTQSDRFIRTARELGCDEDQEAFKRALRQIASAPSPKRRDKSQDDGKPS